MGYRHNVITFSMFIIIDFNIIQIDNKVKKIVHTYT